MSDRPYFYHGIYVLPRLNNPNTKSILTVSEGFGFVVWLEK
jgi:hypothetical protein